MSAQHLLHLTVDSPSTSDSQETAGITFHRVASTQEGGEVSGKERWSLYKRSSQLHEPRWFSPGSSL